MNDFEQYGRRIIGSLGSPPSAERWADEVTPTVEDVLRDLDGQLSSSQDGEEPEEVIGDWLEIGTLRPVSDEDTARGEVGISA